MRALYHDAAEGVRLQRDAFLPRHGVTAGGGGVVVALVVGGHHLHSAAVAVSCAGSTPKRVAARGIARGRSESRPLMRIGGTSAFQRRDLHEGGARVVPQRAWRSPRRRCRSSTYSDPSARDCAHVGAAPVITDIYLGIWRSGACASWAGVLW